MTEHHRLPRDVVPTHYEVRLEPHLDHARFVGRVVIDVDVLAPVERIVLNAADLEVERALLVLDGTTSSLDAILDADTERLVLVPGAQLAVGSASLVIEFTGVLNDKLRGFYRSTFQDDHGDDVVIATTQFQATDARRAFPCWDEPDIKATFGIELVVGDGELAVSNGPEVAREVLADGRTLVRFERTMKMSTYLVAFVVGPMEATEPRTVDGVAVRVIHRPGEAHLTRHALDVATFALDYYATYYGIPYPAAKLDLVAIPDFSFGAMENLGCVTFRDIYLLVDADRASRTELQNVAQVINHELAHMWFGDLVTMSWWNGIWLNEAFATFMEVRATEAFRPEWDPWTGFSFGRSAAFAVDSLESTRSVEYDVVSPDEAEEMFDVLTYEKGASVVRMLEQYLGVEVFREGIRLYLRTHAYGNTETHHLWDALEAVSGEPVREMMEGWIHTGGYPLVWTESSGDGDVTLCQRRFLLDGGTDDTTTWVVPLIARDLEDDKHHRHLLSADCEPSSVPGTAFVNSGAHGFYRVLRSPDELNRLASSLGALSAAERYALIDDAWTTCVAGYGPIRSVLELLCAYRDEDDVNVWRRVAALIAAIDHHTGGADEEGVGDWIDGLTERAFAAAAADTTEDGVERHAVLFGLRGRFGGDLELRAAAPSLADDESAPMALRSAATLLRAAFGDAACLDEFIERYEHAVTPQDRQRHLLALSLFPTADLVARVTAYAMSESVRTQDAPFVLRSLLRHRDFGWSVWEAIVANWDDLLDRLPSNSIPRMLEGIQALNEPEQSVAIHEFLAGHPIAQGEKLIAQHLEQNRIHTAFRTRLNDELASALD